MHLPAALLTSIPAASMTGGSCHCTLRQSPDAATLLAGGEAHSSPEDRPHEVMEVSHRSITLNAESDTIHRQTSKLSPASLASAGTAGALQLTGEPLLCRCEWQVKGVPKCRAPYPHVWPAMSAHFGQRSAHPVWLESCATSPHHCAMPWHSPVAITVSGRLGLPCTLCGLLQQAMPQRQGTSGLLCACWQKQTCHETFSRRVTHSTGSASCY